MADLTNLRRSPLEHLADQLAAASAGATVSVSETPFLGMISLRVDPSAPAAERVAAVLGAPLPTNCGETSGQTLWLGPDEWLVVTRNDPVALADQLEAAIGEDPGLALDVSANRTVIEITGPQARAALEKGCPLDLHPRSFGPGHAVATTLARVPVLLWQIGDNQYRLLPRSSFADYVARWLLDAIREYAG
ncbi:MULTISPECIES: sarcosine oxidase subunit gamma family protein [unclassified Kribbella]|uniref:sarcosine oxidase subunit gamma n=1 Tax=unclassified Kribbella TaxID=2644121 RepID=UPI0033F184A9